MLIQEALQLIETISYTNTGKRLNPIEKEILKAAWNNQTYSSVAKNSYLSAGYIKDVAYRLWKQLSEILGEKVTKTNLRLVLEKKTLSPVIPTPRIFVRIILLGILIQKTIFTNYNRKFRN